MSFKGVSEKGSSILGEEMIVSVKKEYRSFLRGRLRDLTSDQRLAAMIAVSRHLAELLGAEILESLGAISLRVAAYRPHLKTPEVDPLLFLENLETDGGRLFFPSLSQEGGRDLSMEGFQAPLKDWLWVKDERGDLESAIAGGKDFKLTPILLEKCPPEKLDLLLVPGLAFGRSGERLGRGGGYYDRFLPRAPQALKVGLSFDFQLFDRLPIETADFPMDCIVTPGELLVLNPGRLSEWQMKLRRRAAGEGEI